MSKGVLRPGHIQLRVLDIEESLVFYRDRLGLIVTDTDAEGRVYLKAWSEFDKFSVVLRAADEPGMDFLGFKVISVDVLNSLRQELIEYGCSVKDIPAGELNGCGERVRFDLPSGQWFELYAEKEQTGEWGIASKNPEAWPEGLKGMSPLRLDHCQLSGGDIDASMELLCEVLDFNVAEKLVDGDFCIAYFLSCSNKAHDLALMRGDVSGKFHHASFLLESWEQVLRAADIGAMHELPHDYGPTRHGLTHGLTIYFYDPSGNRVETFTGGNYYYPDHPTIVWEADKIAKAVNYHERRIAEHSSVT